MVLLEVLMQPVQVCWCIVILFQGVAYNIYLGRLTCFIVLKALNSEYIMYVGCVSCVIVSTRTFSSDIRPTDKSVFLCSGPIIKKSYSSARYS